MSTFIDNNWYKQNLSRNLSRILHEYQINAHFSKSWRLFLLRYYILNSIKKLSLSSNIATATWETSETCQETIIYRVIIMIVDSALFSEERCNVTIRKVSGLHGKTRAIPRKIDNSEFACELAKSSSYGSKLSSWSPRLQRITSASGVV